MAGIDRKIAEAQTLYLRYFKGFQNSIDRLREDSKMLVGDVKWETENNERRDMHSKTVERLVEDNKSWFWYRDKMIEAEASWEMFKDMKEKGYDYDEEGKLVKMVKAEGEIVYDDKAPF